MYPEPKHRLNQNNFSIIPFLIKRLHPERCNVSGAWVPRTKDEYETYNLCSDAIWDSINYQDIGDKYDIIRVREKSKRECHNLNDYFKFHVCVSFRTYVRHNFIFLKFLQSYHKMSFDFLLSKLKEKYPSVQKSTLLHFLSYLSV